MPTVFRPFFTVFDRFPERPRTIFIRRIRRRTVFMRPAAVKETAETVKTARTSALGARRSSELARPRHHDLVVPRDSPVILSVTFGNCPNSLRSLRGLRGGSGWR